MLCIPCKCKTQVILVHIVFVICHVILCPAMFLVYSVLDTRVSPSPDDAGPTPAGGVVGWCDGAG